MQMILNEQHAAINTLTEQLELQKETFELRFEQQRQELLKQRPNPSHSSGPVSEFTLNMEVK